MACHVSARATSLAPVSAAPVVTSANTALDVSTPVSHASACEARAPERAAKMAVNPAKASGASERTNDAAPASIPVAAR